MQNHRSKRQDQPCKCNGAEREGDQTKAEDDLILAPSATLEVMMDGRHLEQTLAVGELEIAYLQDDREAFTDVDDATKNSRRG